ncbi:hypothetical protein FJT64_016386 [Amphibalanus amphitrite]|uniref:Uncharacterized protein n=1 Tax=Amphibalanus amphitrite TaxID=1232801 RepID=A0A6A4X647_AMPAM|nr:hypothetical protein FJT64_016386 [Amphibalanus amphitrite]
MSTVGTGVTNVLAGRGGAQLVAASTGIQGGGGFSFGTNQVTATAERAGELPIQANSGSTLVSTDQAALGTSQASTLSTEPSGRAGQPSRVAATQAQVSAISVRGGLTDRQQHIGTIEVGPAGPRANIGNVVERQLTRAGQQADRLNLSAAQLRRQAAGFSERTARTVTGSPSAPRAQ